MQKFIFPATIFLAPLFFWTLTPNFFLTPKQLLLIVTLLLLSLHLAFQIFKSKSLELSSSPLRFGLFAFATSVILNLVINPVGRLESILGQGSLYLALSFWAYLLSGQTSHKFKSSILYSFLAGSTILSVHILAQLTFLYKMTALPTFMQSRAFFLTGDALTTLILITLGGALSLSQLRRAINHKPSTIYYLLSSIIHLIAFVALGALLLPGQELTLQLLPLTASWSIALDAMKSLRSFFFGVGLANFPVFYNSVKPLFLNATPFWNILQNNASSGLLQLLTTTGVVGFISFLSLPFLALRPHASDSLTVSLKLITTLSFLALAFTPGSLLLLLIFFTGLGTLSASEPKTTHLPAPGHLIVSLIILSLVGTLGYFTTRFALAEAGLRRAQLAIADNDGQTLYEQSLKTIQLFPRLTAYRLSFSQVNLSLAVALSQKTPLTDTERENITKLLSQAVSEAKLATSLSPSDSKTWQNLGNLYRNLINVAEGVDRFAIESFAQAVALDPANPALRVEFGGLLYQLAQITQSPEDQASYYNRAQSEFQIAIQLKPDYPNAYYNLAKLQEAREDYVNAAVAMQKAISLLGPDNADLARANSELDAIKAKLPRSEAKTPSEAEPSEVESSQLSKPSPLPTPLDGGPIELPADGSTPNL